MNAPKNVKAVLPPGEREIDLLTETHYFEARHVENIFAVAARDGVAKEDVRLYFTLRNDLSGWPGQLSARYFTK